MNFALRPNSWEEDFRRRSIVASAAIVGDIYLEDPFALPVSFCLPAGDRPTSLPERERFRGALLLLFILLLALGSLTFRWLDGWKGPARDLFVFGFWIVTFTTLLLPFLPVTGLLLRLRLGARGRRLSERVGRRGVTTAALLRRARDGQLYMLVADRLLIGFDDVGRSLLIEGIDARYQIRAADVTAFRRMAREGCLGVDVVYRIDPDTQLQLSLGHPRPFLVSILEARWLWFVHAWIPNPLFTRGAKTLDQKL